MEYYRYGKFNFSDYYGSWFGIAVLLIFTIASITLDLSASFVIFPTVYILIWLWKILMPNRERFVVCDDYIRVLVGRKTQNIIIPSELTLVVSYADICPPLAMRTAVGNETHILKDKYAVSILHKMPLDATLEALHHNYLRKYTTSTIRALFDDCRYIYDFVCDQYLLDKLIANRDCQLIVPGSLSEKISVDSNYVNIHIDTRC